MLIKNVTKGNSFEADIADNLWLQTKGLSFSKPRNMLFKFPISRKWEFWMFGVSYGIWMAFIDDDGGVFDVTRAEKITLNPKTWKTYKPSRPCKLVLETPAKLADVGDIVTFFP
jgi:uncharacterized membrane protein (UPF0127 family)